MWYTISNKEKRETMKCTLCEASTSLFKTIKERDYLQCNRCKGILLDHKHYLDQELEKERYEVHNNDVEDKGYQAFVLPIVTGVLKDYTKDHIGLDFGSGPGPVVTKLLTEKDYNIKMYDPFFANNPERLNRQYDYIVCCEVMEHFYNPAEEFKLLKSLLKPEGTLYLKTNLYYKDINFDAWYYKNDATHVFFYQKETLEWIQKHYEFADLKINKDMIILGGKI